METVSGYVEHIIFQNNENGYTVMNLMTEGGGGGGRHLAGWPGLRGPHPYPPEFGPAQEPAGGGVSPAGPVRVQRLIPPLLTKTWTTSEKVRTPLPAITGGKPRKPPPGTGFAHYQQSYPHRYVNISPYKIGYFPPCRIRPQTRTTSSASSPQWAP